MKNRLKSRIVDVMIVCVLAFAVISIPDYTETVKQAWQAAERPVVVIDPGHGGMDGGAEGSDGTSEKDINLSIALKLMKQLRSEGIRVVMTRQTDEGLYNDDGNTAIRTLKTQDMYERKRIIDEADADLTVSIHLNSFTQDTSVKGAQVFYPGEGDEAVAEQSRLAAEIIQSGLNKNINTDKKRSALAKSDVLLLREACGPTIIVECGFLSNSEDLSDLKNKEHQVKITKSLKSSICKYLIKNGNDNQ